MEMSLNLISINAKCLNSLFKLALLTIDINLHKGDVVFMQETHLSSENMSHFHIRNFQANVPAEKRRVLIAIKETVNLKVSHFTADHQGCYVILICSLNEMPFTLVNIQYMPRTKVRAIWS